MAGPTAEEMLQFIQGGSGTTPAAPSIIAPQEIEEDETNVSPSANEMLQFIQGDTDTSRIEEPEISQEPTVKSGTITSDNISMLPSADVDMRSTEEYIAATEGKDISDPSFRSGFDRTRAAIERSYGQSTSDEEVSEWGKTVADLITQVDEQGRSVLSPIRGVTPDEKLIASVAGGGSWGADIINQLVSALDVGGSFALDTFESVLENLADPTVTQSLPFGDRLKDNAYKMVESATNELRGVSGLDSPADIADLVGQASMDALEFSESLPAIGTLSTLLSVRNLAPKLQAKYGVKANIKAKKLLETANRYNPEGAKLATLEAAEEASQTAARAAAEHVDLSNELIIGFETKIGGRDIDGNIIDDSKIISTERDGVLVVDEELSRKVGRETAQEITERDGALFDLALGEDVITSPILNPNKFDGIVAAAAELKQLKPDAFDNKKTVIDNLLHLSISKDFDADIGGQKLIDILNKYGLSFEDYVLTVVGSGSDAGKVLNALSRIKRKKPQNIIDADEAARKAREAGDLRRGIMRVENIRRGGLVSQVVTAARNLTSGAIRAPMEALGNVMDTAIYTVQNKGVKGLLSRDIWSGSFSNMKYMFSRPDVAKGYTDLILGRPEMAKQFDAMYNNINEIQKLTGRGSGGKVDKVLSGMEDLVDTLNTPNRWQEYLIRRGQFFGELERLTKRHYDIDLIDALNEGKLKDLMNDASSIRPEGAPSFVKLVDDSVTRALDVTYAKQPEIPLFRELSSFITRNGLTVVMPFPRFMFNSMELMGQYAAGASIPLTRKMTQLVTLGKVGSGPLTAKDRQRITRNMMGMAAVGAAYIYRNSEDTSPEFNQVAVGAETQMDTTAIYPMAQFLYMGEATKRLMNGTFDDWFDKQEFVELFTGSNFRTGVGNSILEEVALIADGTDLMAGESVGRAAGRTLGNYLSTWAVPFAQIIDAQRATGVRGTEYKDVAEDPTLDPISTFGNEIKRSFQQRGFALSPEEEAELPAKEYPFYPEGKERVLPTFKLAGVTLTSRPPATAEYLMSLGFDYKQFGSKSKVPSIKAFEQRMINGHMDALVSMAQGQEDKLRKEYEAASNVVKEEFTLEEYVANKVRPLIAERLTEFKSKIREGAISQGDSYARAITKYRRIQPQFRKLASTDFIERFDRQPDATDPDDIKILIQIAKAYKEAY